MARLAFRVPLIGYNLSKVPESLPRTACPGQLAQDVPSFCRQTKRSSDLPGSANKGFRALPDDDLPDLCSAREDQACSRPAVKELVETIVSSSF
jgi:hypothetical protein